MVRLRLLHILSGLLVAALVWPVTGGGQSRQGGTAAGEWPAYGGDERSLRYAPLDQINKDTVKNLQVAWTCQVDAFVASCGSCDRVDLPWSEALYAQAVAAPPFAPRHSFDYALGRCAW